MFDQTNDYSYYPQPQYYPQVYNLPPHPNQHRPPLPRHSSLDPHQIPRNVLIDTNHVPTNNLIDPNQMHQKVIIGHHIAPTPMIEHSLHNAFLNHSRINKEKIVKRRGRTGCITCRKRHIKCDERKPGCSNCERSKKKCLGYEDLTKPKRKRDTSLDLFTKPTLNTTDKLTHDNEQHSPTDCQHKVFDLVEASSTKDQDKPSSTLRIENNSPSEMNTAQKRTSVKFLLI